MTCRVIYSMALTLFLLLALFNTECYDSLVSILASINHYGDLVVL